MPAFQVISFLAQISQAELSDLMVLADQQADSTSCKGDSIWPRKIIADSPTGYPCRLSLADARVGEAVLLFHHCHHQTQSPYRASGPIYVRWDQAETKLPVNQLPAFLVHRQLSIRVYDVAGMLRTALVVSGRDALQAIHKQVLPQISGKGWYAHLHNAATGCFLLALSLVAD